MSITYSECVFLALGIQHAVPMHHFVVCGLSSFTTHYIINGTIFEKKILNIRCMF